MKCKHGQSVFKCDTCLTKTLKYVLMNERKTCPCYVNAFISLPIGSTNVIRSFTEEEVFFGSGRNECITIPLTSVCSGSSLRIGDCKSPENAWCKVIDQANEYITSIQVPDCCDGCYNFDLSASVALTATMTVNLRLAGGSALFTPNIFVNIPVKATLRLSEQLLRDICVADEVSETPRTCFTSVTFPIIDTASATENISTKSLIYILDVLQILLGLNSIFRNTLLTLLNQETHYTNISVSGNVCLKSCQRLVPTLTISQIQSPSSFINTLNEISLQTFLSIDFTNIKLLLSDLSLKLVRLGN